MAKLTTEKNPTDDEKNRSLIVVVGGLDGMMQGLDQQKLCFSFVGDTTGVLLCYLYRRPRAVFFYRASKHGESGLCRNTTNKSGQKTSCEICGPHDPQTTISKVTSAECFS